MDNYEYKIMYADFAKGLRDLVCDIEDVGDGEISDAERCRELIEMASQKLADYQHYLKTLEPLQADDLHKDFDGDMKYIEQILNNMGL